MENQKPPPTSRWKLFLTSRPILALLLGCVAVFGSNYGFWDLEGPDEGRYVQVAKELLGRSNWFLLTVHGRPYDQKPPLPYWMMAIMLKLSGGAVSAWAARFPSVFFSAVAVVCTFLIGRHRFGHRAGLISAFILLTSPILMRQAPTARLDALFAGWVTLTMCAYLTHDAQIPMPWGRWALFWLAFAGAFFVKGPLMFVIVLPMALAECWREKSWKPWRCMRPAIGLPLLLTAIGIWLLAQAQSAGGEFVKKQMTQGLWGRLFKSDHSNPPWYYAVHMMGDLFMPWTIFLAAAVYKLWKSRKGEPLGALRPILWWALFPLLIFHLMIGKRAPYFLPVIPALALVTGWYCDQWLDRAKIPAWLGRVLGGIGFALAATLAAVILIVALQPEYFWAQQFYLELLPAIGLLIPCAILAGISYWMMRRANPARVLVFLVAVMLTLGAGYNAVVNPAKTYKSSSVLFSRALEARLPAGENRIAAFGKAEDSKYHVYGRYEVVPIASKGKSETDFSTLPTVVIVREEDKMFGRALEDHGYTLVDTTTVDSDPLMVFSRAIEEANVLPEPLRFAALGDAGEGNRRQRHVADRMAELNDRTPLTAVLLLGDNLYGDESFEIAMKKRFLNPYQSLLEKKVPFFAVLGNHDVEVKGRAEAEMNTPLFHMGGRDHYLKTFKTANLDVTFFLLNSNQFFRNQEQTAWFRDELANNHSKWKVLVMHHPMKASQIAHAENEPLDDMLTPIISGPNGIDLVLTGHNHVYERRKITDGVQHITIGNGGALSFAQFEADANRVVGYNAASCFGILEFKADELHFRAVDSEGEAVDDVLLKKTGDASRLTAIETGAGASSSVLHPTSAKLALILPEAR
ncbi:glycosyltransferase family 39 protein [Candidatus Sumerlaeota bacterium]|nr:glycosyltransferase family 39 protein [Candidatus Sumerlaeota bacterium]